MLGLWRQYRGVVRVHRAAAGGGNAPAKVRRWWGPQHSRRVLRRGPEAAVAAVASGSAAAPAASLRRPGLPGCASRNSSWPSRTSRTKQSAVALRIGQGVVGVAVGDLEALAEPLESDGVLELKEKPGQSRGIQVVVGEGMTQSPGHQTGVEAVGRVLDQNCAPSGCSEGGGNLA